MGLVYNIFSKSTQATLVLAFVHNIIAKTALETRKIAANMTSSEIVTVMNDPQPATNVLFKAPLVKCYINMSV